MKKLINKTENIVREMLEGIADAYPDILEKIPDFNIIKRKIIDNKVVRRSKRYPNYGITIDATPYRWSTNRKMKINNLIGNS